MRAGSLSDARIVALLRTHFVCVHMPELVTKHLIRNKEDLALLEKYDAQLAERAPGFLTPRLQGGEREVFFTPEGELVDIFLSLNAGSQKQKQYSRSSRARPEAAVRRFFRGARKALRRVYGRVPDDFASLRDGSAPAVAAASKASTARRKAHKDGLDLLVWVRNDLLMYEALVGDDLLRMSASEARSLLPAKLAAGQQIEWPAKLFRRFAHCSYPRGAGVHMKLADSSITGRLATRIDRVEGGLVSGRFVGELGLAAPTLAERGYRKHYRPFRKASARLVGDFVWNERAARFKSFRLVSKEGRGEYGSGIGKPTAKYALAVELLRP